MKNRLLILLVFSFLCVTPVAHAGFVVKKAAALSGTTIAKSHISDAKITAREKSANFIAKLNQHLGFLHPYRLHKENQWFGIAAIGCGILGLLVPGVNLLAILFGILGMGRGCKAQGLAVTGFVMGMLELALFLILDTVFVSLILL